MDGILEMFQRLHPEVDFETNERLFDDKIIDSFDIVSVIAEINDEYDIAIPAEEIVPENFNSVKALSLLVKRLTDE